MLKRTKNSSIKTNQAQTAIEYMLLLAVVVSIVLLGMRGWLDKSRNAAEFYFNEATIAILGAPPACGDGYCDNQFEDDKQCCTDCGGCGNYIENRYGNGIF